MRGLRPCRLRGTRCDLRWQGTVPRVDESSVSIPFPEPMLEAIAERVAALVIERIEDGLRPSAWMRALGAAEYVGLTRSALYNRVGRIPHYKVDRLLLFKREDLDIWMDQHRREPAGAASWLRAASPPRSPRSSRLAETTFRSRVRTGQAKPKRERPLLPPLSGNEDQKAKWARELEISRPELDAMSPTEFKRTWAARNERLREGGVFEHIGELLEKLGSRAMKEMHPSALIQAVHDLGRS